jgi:phospholipid/cholesterol/gamma-HCH transport system permease protein
MKDQRLSGMGAGGGGDAAVIEPEPTSIDLRAKAPARTGVELIGAAVLDLLTTARELYSVFVRTLHYCVSGRREPGSVLAQMYAIGNKSIFFLSVAMGFIGMILVRQGGLQTKRVLPDLSLIGATYLELLIRDFAASIGALLLATRVGAGIAAEIGSMVVTEQVDALRMCAADPIDYLIKPRFLASLIMTTCLVIWSAAVAFLAGMATAYISFDVSPRTFMNLTLVDAGDLTVGLAKCLAYGAAIPIVAGHSGLMTFGGSEGVGWATTRAVINASLAVIILNVVISTLGFLVFRG